MDLCGWEYLIFSYFQSYVTIALFENSVDLITIFAANLLGWRQSAGITSGRAEIESTYF